jgi:hypothetical protein
MLVVIVAAAVIVVVPVAVGLADDAIAVAAAIWSDDATGG